MPNNQQIISGVIKQWKQDVCSIFTNIGNYLCIYKCIYNYLYIQIYNI